MAKMIFSEYNNAMINEGFTKHSHNLATGRKSKTHYTWNETDLIYYNDDVDDDWFMELPITDIVFCYQTSKGNTVNYWYELD